MDRLYLTMLAVAASTIVRPATALNVVNASASDVNDAFGTDVTVTDMTSPIFGGGFLQSRIFQQAGGTWVYEYRLDLRNAQSITNVPYATSVALSTGPVLSTKATGEVFVITAGGLGTIGLQSASGLFGYHTFEFTTPVWAGDTSYLWGYVSSSPPQVVTATVATSNGNIQLNAYAPHW